MKILMINGTMRKSSTYFIGKRLIQKLSDRDDAVDEIFLPEALPHFCLGCGKCFSNHENKCPHYEWMSQITKRIDAADLLVFTSPVFVMRVSGQMKTLLDHYGYRFMVHRPEGSMFQKQAVCITTAAGAGMRSACKDMKTSLTWWGVGRIYTYGKAVAAVSWDHVQEKKKQKIERDISRLARRIQIERRYWKPGLTPRILFLVFRQVQKHGFNEADRSYWEKQGWLGKRRPWKID